MNSTSVFELSSAEKLQLVELDIAEAYRWHERRIVGLGEEFLSSVDASLEGIRRWPEMYVVVHEKFRRALIRRFPYAVFYEHSDSRVTIYAVFHTARDPEKWKSRLSGSRSDN